jgi:hypothetical protein
MKGDDRVRFCSECKLNVYDFSALTISEVEQLLARTEGRLCGRLFRRSDGTVLTRDCPSGFRATVRRLSRIAGAAFSAMAFGAGLATAQSRQELPSTSLVQIDSLNNGIVIEVVDPRSTVIPNARVLILGEAGEHLAEGITDSNGRFVSTNLEPGFYVIRIESDGLTTEFLRSMSVPYRGILRLKLSSIDAAVMAPDMGWVVASPARLPRVPALRPKLETTRFPATNIVEQTSSAPALVASPLFPKQSPKKKFLSTMGLVQPLIVFKQSR